MLLVYDRDCILLGFAWVCVCVCFFCVTFDIVCAYVHVCMYVCGVGVCPPQEHSFIGETFS